jgi:hypothetical protein
LSKSGGIKLLVDYEEQSEIIGMLDFARQLTACARLLRSARTANSHLKKE